jgi:hypothetical protein
MSGPNLQVASARKRMTRGVFPTVKSTGKRKVAADNPVKNIPDTFRNQGFVDIEARATALGLGRLASPQSFVGTDQQSDTVGNKSVRNSTIDRYFSTLPGFIKFCMLVGDPQSAIMAHIAGCCEHPCPPSESAYINYARYHVLMEGEVLLDYTTNRPVLFNTQSVKCVGDWRSKETLGIFRSAIGFISKAYEDCTGKYEKACSMCAILATGSEKGCERRGHTSPMLLPRGNVTKSQDSKEQLKILEDYIEVHYTLRYTVALLPSELRLVLERCLSGNSLAELMVWVIFLLSVRQYLRATEVLMLTVEEWNMDCAKVSENDVLSLLLNVNGKRDTGTGVNLACWTDAECAEFSACTAVLIWISVTGILQVLDRISGSPMK